MGTEVTTNDLIAANIKRSVSKPIVHKISTCHSILSCKGSPFRIKQKSHEELDIEIQSVRILCVLDELIEKLEVVVSAPHRIRRVKLFHASLR